jgi:4'-phosphopantetheinyl transferase
MNVDRILPIGDLHIWQFRTATALDGERLHAVLNPAERARADRFVRETAYRRFVVSHGALRSILGEYFGIPAESVALGRSSLRKPFLPSALDVHFNLSHSADLAVIAGTPVGIDIEQIHRLGSAGGIASRYFPAMECAALESLAEVERLSALFLCWTRKEAYLRARGDGLSLPLDSFSVSIGADSPALLHSDFGPEEIGRWKLAGVHPAPGYAGAVAVELAPPRGPGMDAGRIRMTETISADAQPSWRGMEVDSLV